MDRAGPAGAWHVAAPRPRVLREAAGGGRHDAAPASFAADVLAARPANLAVLPVTGVQWSDWGRPARVLSTLAGLGIRPDWAERVMATA
jgi:hypothetical protein